MAKHIARCSGHSSNPIPVSMKADRARIAEYFLSTATSFGERQVMEGVLCARPLNLSSRLLDGDNDVGVCGCSEEVFPVQVEFGTGLESSWNVYPHEVVEGFSGPDGRVSGAVEQVGLAVDDRRTVAECLKVGGAGR
jgi:hypothetical protein